MKETLLSEINDYKAEIEASKKNVERFRNKFADELISNGIEFDTPKKSSKIKNFFIRLFNTVQ